MHYSFEKEKRISRKSEILSLLRNGVKCQSTLFTLFFKKNRLNKDRFAVIVSRKLGSAVERNRVKRVFREIFRQSQSTNPPFHDIILKPRTGIIRFTKREVEHHFVVWKNSLHQ